MLSFRGLSPQHCLFSSPSSASFPCLSFLFFPCWLLPPGSCSPTSANTIFTHTLYKDFDLNVLCLHHKLKQEPSRLFLLHTLWLQSNSAYPHQEISLNKYLFRYVSVRDRETTDSPTNANSGWVWTRLQQEARNSIQVPPVGVERTQLLEPSPGASQGGR